MRRLNQFVEQRAPWNLAKDDDAAGQLDETLYGLAEGLRVVSILLHPYIPDAAGRALAALGEYAGDVPPLEYAEFGARPGGAEVERITPLFPKVETAEAASSQSAS